MSGKDIQITLTGEPAPIMTMLQYLGRQPRIDDFAESKVYDSVEDYLAGMPQEPAKCPGLKDRDLLTTMLPEPKSSSLGPHRPHRDDLKRQKKTKIEVEKGAVPSLAHSSVDTKQLHGSYPQNFYEAPIEPLQPVPPEPGKNKYGRWDTPVSEEIDAEISRLHSEGKSTHEISAMLSERDINITWQRVRGRIAYMARKGHNSPKAEVEPSKEQLPAKEPDMPTKAEPSPLMKRIIELDHQKMTPHTISDIIEEETGEVVTESQIMDIIVRNAKGML